MKKHLYALAVVCRRHYITIIAGLVLLVLLPQVFYPSDRLPLAAAIDGKKMGGWTKQDAARILDEASSQQSIDIHIEGQATVYKTVTPAEFGLSVAHASRIDSSTYPWLMRLIPTSLLWYQAAVPSPEYRRDAAARDAYITKEFGKDCLFAPQNATIEHHNGELRVIPARAGGRCDTDTVRQQLDAASPVLTQAAKVMVTVEPIAATITTATAEQTKRMIEDNIGQGITVTVGSNKATLKKQDVYSWLDITPTDKKLAVTLDPKKADSYLNKNIAAQVAKTAGTTYVTTRDFTEISRRDGATGRALDRTATRATIVDVVYGRAKAATAKTRVVQPTVRYTYTYTKSKTGIAALMRNFDKDNAGRFGVSLIELNGSGVASHQGDHVFTTASTYKLFVAYGTLRKVEKGAWKWTDAVVAGRNLATCFDDMIVKSDNACAEVLLERLGYSALTSDLRALGLARSGFTGRTPETTAHDLALFLAKLQRGDLPISTSSKNRLLAAMKRNIYRQGIPAGASGTVADKVGFLDGLLHDAAIVYSPKGTYVLVVMSNGSSWAKIAQLTREIEKLR